MAKVSSDPKQRLLEAGLRLFAHRGYAGTSVQEIAERARVTKPTLYYYFGNKEGLFQALVDQAMDERLRRMHGALREGMTTAEKLTAIITTLTEFAQRHPDLLRLCFVAAFAAPGEMPSGFRKHEKIHDSYHFTRELIAQGCARGELDPAFDVEELTRAYFQLAQHAIVLAVLESKLRASQVPIPPPTDPRRMVELFLKGAAAKTAPAKRARNGVARALAMVMLALGLPLALPAQTTNTPAATVALGAHPDTSPGNPANTPPPSAPPLPAVAPAAPGPSPAGTGISLEDQRPVPAAVKASHPELATVSPIAANADNPHALDLQTCFQLTAVRDDSLKISMQDVEIARAQMSQSIAALWPSFTATNQQEFIHYSNPTSSGFSITSLGVAGAGTGGTGSSTSSFTETSNNRNYQSQSHVTMSYTVFNGGQNYNSVGAASANIAAKRETLARDYQTIYQDVAQAFYNVLQYQGDEVIENDLIDGLSARVDDLRDRVRLGRSRPAELLQAQTDLANARVTLESQTGSMNASRETLAFYIGIPSRYFTLKETQDFPTAKQLEYYLMHSGSRPDVLSQLESLRQAERNLDVATGQLFPTVTASGDYLASQDPVSNSVDATMTLQISMPIFDGGLILGQIHQNKALVRQSALNVEEMQRTADEDTRTAYANFNASVAQVVVLREAAVLASKNLEAQVNDYRLGVVSNLDVLTALEDYQNARIQLHNANMQTRLDLINLHVAAGTAARGPGANGLALPTGSISAQ
jgi:outer membrane protein